MVESRRHSGERERGIVGGLGFGGRDVADGLEEPATVAPVNSFERGVLDGLLGAPRAAPVDDLGLEAVDDLGQGVVIAVADAAAGRLDPGLGQPLGVLDADVLGGFNRSSQHPDRGGCDDRLNPPCEPR